MPSPELHNKRRKLLSETSKYCLDSLMPSFIHCVIWLEHVYGEVSLVLYHRRFSCGWMFSTLKFELNVQFLNNLFNSLWQVLSIILISLLNNGFKYDWFKYNGSWTTDFDGIWIVCYAYNAFHSPVIITTSLLLEEPKGAKSHNNYYSYGSHICYRLICGFTGHPREQSILPVFGLN